MLKKLLAVFLSVLILFSTQICYAATINTSKIGFDLDNGTIKISGTVSDSSKKVSLVVYKPEGTLEKLDGGSNANIVLSNAFQLTPNDYGVFSVEYPIEDVGRYTAVIYYDGTTRTIISEHFASAADRNELIAKANTDTADSYSDSELVALLDDYLFKFSIDPATYNTLSESNKLKVAQGLLAKDDYSKSSEIVAEICKSTVTYAFTQAKDAQTIRSLIDTYNEYLMLDLNNHFFANYLTEDSFRDVVYDKLAGGSYAGVEDIQSAFATQCALQSVNLSETVDKLYTLFTSTSSKSYFSGMNIDGYKSLSSGNQIAVMTKMMETNFTALDKVVKTFNSLVDSYGGSGGTGGQGPGGGGGVDQSASSKKPAVSTPAGDFDSDSDINNGKVYQKAEFKDLSGVEWAEDCIYELAYMGVIQGKGDGLFAPNDSVTRAEFVKMIVSALGLELSDTELPFSDTTPGDWHYKYIAAAYQNGLVRGISKTEFGVDDLITREDMAVIANNMAVFAGKTIAAVDSAAFADDAEISDYARDSVYAIKSISVIKGMDDNMFAPKLNASRAQAARIIYGMYRYINFGG